MLVARLGSNQIAALEIYVFDPIFYDDDGSGDPVFPGHLDTAAKTLTVDDVETARDVLVNAANAADYGPRDAVLRDALDSLRRRITGSRI